MVSFRFVSVPGLRCLPAACSAATLSVPSAALLTGRDDDRRRQELELDRVLPFAFRVLFAKSKDWIVISVSLCPGLYFAF